MASQKCANCDFLDVDMIKKVCCRHLAVIHEDSPLFCCGTEIGAGCRPRTLRPSTCHADALTTELMDPKHVLWGGLRCASAAHFEPATTRITRNDIPDLCSRSQQTN